MTQPEEPVPGSLRVHVGGRVLRLPPESILWVEAENQYARVHTVTSEEHVVSRPLAAVHQALGGERFIRIHRSAVVNVDFVGGVVGGHSVLLANGVVLRLSRRRRAEVVRRLGSRPRGADLPRE